MSADVHSAEPERRRWLPRTRRKRALLAIRVAALAMLVYLAASTPGFLTTGSLISLLTTTSFIGCVAIGMTFITLSGNVVSFTLGATLGATTIVFMMSLPLGLGGALLVAFSFSAALTGGQGFVVGYFRANPIIVSIAALSLILGLVTLTTGGRGIHPSSAETDMLKGDIGPVPKSLAAFLLTVVVGQLILSFTRFGRNIYMVGSNLRAAEAAGIVTWRPVTGAYVLAGLCTAFTAVLMAARYGSGDMEHGLGYDYQAISSVLVGGTAISGGEGSALRTLAGAFIIAVVEGLLLLNGFGTQWQYLTIGLIVLGVIMLQSLGEER